MIGLIPSDLPSWRIAALLERYRVRQVIDFSIVFLDKRIPFSYTEYQMTTTTIHIKTEIKTRDAAKKVAEDFGFTLTSLVNALLKQIARNKRLTLSLEENPTPYMVESLKRSEADVKAGRVVSFASGKDALEYLAREITYEKRAAH
jgi:addiction module RelB/DinJ family antitoxin